jgi:ribonuclease-3
LATKALEAALALRFRDRRLLEQALVHRSFVNEQGWSPADSYERLEFLGDAVLELAISDELYQRCPSLTEGELTKGRAALVCQETLAQVARRLNLGDFVLLGKGEEASGGRGRDSLLAAAFESVAAAVYLDRGYPHARKFILRVMAPELDEFLSRGEAPEDPKSRLQEYVQGLGRPSPRYRVVSSDGPAHGPTFTVEVLVEDEVVGTGLGRSKVSAERKAAWDALERLVGRLGESGKRP